MNKGMSMMRKSFLRDMEKIDSSIVGIGEITANGINNAIYAHVTSDKEKAKTVIESLLSAEDVSDDIQKKCITIIALQQPVFASDLKIVMSIIKILTKFKEIRNIAGDIAHKTLQNDMKYTPEEIEYYNALGEYLTSAIKDLVSMYFLKNQSGSEAFGTCIEEFEKLCEDTKETLKGYSVDEFYLAYNGKKPVYSYLKSGLMRYSGKSAFEVFNEKVYGNRDDFEVSIYLIDENDMKFFSNNYSEISLENVKKEVVKKELDRESLLKQLNIKAPTNEEIDSLVESCLEPEDIEFTKSIIIQEITNFLDDCKDNFQYTFDLELYPEEDQLKCICNLNITKKKIFGLLAKNFDTFYIKNNLNEIISKNITANILINITTE
uniref:Phosphate uptake regulator, PhoU n=1 Tax=Methanococcus maripaludis (strain C6 / ATCC BAA-1332) TaxID=444158 RepID=A9A9E5_METM6